jgi:PAS domain-containing protein
MEHTIDKLNEQIADFETRLSLALACGIGVWDWTMSGGTDVLFWDDTMHALFGLPRSEFAGTVEAFLACLHPDDATKIAAALQHAKDTRTTYDVVYRLVSVPGRRIRARGTWHYRKDGTADRMVGICLLAYPEALGEPLFLSDQPRM